MAASQSLALKHWTRILRRWPVDRVRPENVSFQKVMKQRLDQRLGLTTPKAAVKAAKSKEAVEPVALPEWIESRELRQANVLYSLLEDRYAKEFPLPENLRKPASNPSYYDDLVTEIQEAPTRSWFGSFMKRIKGSLRLT